MAQGNRSYGSDFDDVVVPIESEENRSLGTGAQGYYRPRRAPAYRNYYHIDDSESCDCFPDSTKIQLHDGRTSSMKDLKPGDRVQVTKPDGSLAYSPFLAMLHREPDKKATFRQIYVEEKKEPIRLTNYHLIYATKNPQGRPGRPVFAKDVEEGMFVFVVDEESKKVVPGKVREVRETEATGFCAPLTKEGSIMADGVAASCYTIVDHDLSHKAFWPLRLRYVLKSALGGVGKEKKVAKVGIHWYAKGLMKVNKFLFRVQPVTAM